MPRLQFSIRQLLIAVVVVAAGLFVFRAALRTQGLATGLICLLIVVATLLIFHTIVTSFLTALGAILAREGSDKECVAEAPAEAG